jgi:ubiquinone/menaquinone biosynthesis C-methylase UbiE
MPTEREVYARHAADYERLVAREDHEGNLARALGRIPALRGGTVVELGAGTGRLTRVLAPAARAVWAFDDSAHMLRTAAACLGAAGETRWHLAAADHRRLPLRGRVADAVVAGWSLCYLAVWGGAAWRAALDQALEEMRRVLRPGGVAVVLETLGTGCERPAPPEHLRAYFAYLEEHGFVVEWLRTDFRFDSVAEACELTRFFFGEERAQAVARAGSPVLPECTGLWQRAF